jgi:hypothetical protein
VVSSTMAGFRANDVFRDIEMIATSGGTTKERSARAEQRIDQFKSDLVEQRFQPGEADKIKDQLRKKLEDAINNPRNVGIIASVLLAALDWL